MGDATEPLIDRIYEAALFPDIWGDVLQRIERHVDGAAATLRLWRPDSWGGIIGSPEAETYREQYEASAAVTSRGAAAKLLALNRAGFVAEHEVMSEEEFLLDPLMTVFGSVVGVHHAAATMIFVPGGDAAILQLWRRTGKPRFDPDDLARLDLLRPHLARAAMLATRLRLEQMQARTDALEALGMPAAVLDTAGRVVAANGFLQTMDAHIVWLAGDRIALRDKAAGAILKSTCKRAGATGVAMGRSFAARDANDADPIVVHVVPLKGDGRDLFGQGAFLLAVNRLAASMPNSFLLQGLFDLTAAEARVAAGLLDGLSVTELSERDSVSLATVRTQVRAVLEKSGMSRQAEFIAKLRGVSLPP